MDSKSIETSHDFLELSVRTRNVLKYHFTSLATVTLKDVACVSEDALISTRGCGQNTLSELKTVLASRGLQLGMSDIQFSPTALAAEPDSLAWQEMDPAFLADFWSIQPSVRTENVIVSFFGNISSQRRFSDRSQLLLDIFNRPKKDIYLGDIVCFTPNEYLSLLNFGRKSLAEIEGALLERGLRLGAPHRQWAEIAAAPQLHYSTKSAQQKPEADPALFVNLDHYSLSVRTRNGIFHFLDGLKDYNQSQLGQIQYAMLKDRPLNRQILLGDIVQFSEQEILNTPNFGRNSLDELKAILESNGLYFGMSLAEWDNELIESFFNKGGSALEVNLSAVEQSKFDAYLPARQVTLEDEIEALFKYLEVKSPRNITIFKRRLGLDGKGGETLEEIGSGYGVTRERVRQIEKKVKRKFNRKLLIALSKLDAIKKYLASISLKPLSELSTVFVDRGWTQKPFDVRGIIELYNLLSHNESSFDACEIARLPGSNEWYFFRGSTKSLISGIRSEISRISSSRGFFRLSDLDRDFCRLQINSTERRLISDIVDEFDDIACLDEATGSYFIPEKRNRLQNAILKCLYSFRPIKPNRIKDGLRRYPRLQRIPSTSELVSFCKAHPDFFVQDGLIGTNLPLSPEDTFSKTEHYFINCFKDPAAVLTFEQMKRLCLREGMNPVSFYLLSKRTPVLESDGNRNYALRGNPLDPFKLDIGNSGFDLNSLKDALTDLKHGVSEDGYDWVSFSLNVAIIDTGAVQLPTEFMSRLSPETRLINSEGDLLGKTKRLNENITGLRNILEDKGAESGDHVILVYNHLLDKMLIEVGSNERIEQSKEAGAFEDISNDGLVTL